MIALAPEALADDRAARRSPASRASSAASRSALVLTIAPWNYPYLTAVNSVVPALAGGQRGDPAPLGADAALRRALRRGVRGRGAARRRVPVLHCDHADVEWLIATLGGRLRRVHRLGRRRAARCSAPRRRSASSASGLELGGKDPAYVRPDADLGHRGRRARRRRVLQRRPVVLRHRAHLRTRGGLRAVRRGLRRAHARSYVLGDPRDPATTLGPMVRAAAAELVRAQIAEALARRRARADRSRAPSRADAPGTPYLAPQVLVDVDHSMRVMTEETLRSGGRHPARGERRRGRRAA